MIEWIDVNDRLPPSGDLHAWLITDGENIGIGWYEEEYISDNPEEDLQYSSAMWHQDGAFLWTEVSGAPRVSHWAPLPALPKKKEDS